jgi:hypothetical protein
MMQNTPMKTVKDIPLSQLVELLGPYGLEIQIVADGSAIPGSYWGDEEAGLIGSRLLLRDDTPVHSALHEACHYICMDQQRKEALHTDAGGTDVEENAVCYLQILLADKMPSYSSGEAMQDMDSWGYSFRNGSAKSWFESDAEDAVEFLLERDLHCVKNQQCE